MLAFVTTTNFTPTTAADGSTLLYSGPLIDPTWVSVVFYATLYLTLTFITTYFSAALVAGLLQRFKGEQPTVKSAFSTANTHISSLFRLSLLTATIGFVLQSIEDRVPLAGKIATWIAGAAWSVASMFAIPAIVSTTENIGPINATRRSVDIIKKTWGETVILSIGIGLVSMLSIIAFMVTMGAAGILTASILSTTSAGTAVIGVSLGAIGLVGFVGLVGLTLLFTMLSAVVKAAIFHYATTGQAPQGFEQDILRASFTPKKARGVFAL